MQASLSSTELSHAAFVLLSSSTLERYIRQARLLAEHIALRRQLKSSPDKVSEVLARATELIDKLFVNPVRDVAEAELAAILPILAMTGHPQAQQILQRVALLDQANTIWLSGLARRIVKEGAMNASETVGNVRSSFTLPGHRALSHAGEFFGFQRNSAASTTSDVDLKD